MILDKIMCKTQTTSLKYDWKISKCSLKSAFKRQEKGKQYDKVNKICSRGTLHGVQYTFIKSKPYLTEPFKEFFTILLEGEQIEEFLSTSTFEERFNFYDIF
jgi:hypothetical protein